MKNVSCDRKNFMKWYVWLIWFIFIFTAIFASSLPGVDLFGSITLYPFRIFLIFGMAMLMIGKYGKHPMMRKIRIVFIFLLFYGTLELAWCIDRTQTIKTLINYIFMWVFLEILFYSIKTPNMLKNTLLFISGLIVILQIMGLAEGMTGKYFFSVEPRWNEIVNEKGYYSPITVFGNPNDFIFVLITFMPLFFCVTNHLTKNKIVKFIMRAVYIVLTLVLAEFAQCRMGTFGVLIVLYLYALMGKGKNVVLFITFLLVCAAFVAMPEIMERLAGESRIKIWIDHFGIAKLYNFMGVGAGNSFLRVPGFKYLGSPINPHFWFLEIFVEFGFIAFAVVMWFYFGLTYKTYKTYRADRRNHYAKAAMVSVISFIPLSIMSSSISTTPWFYLMIGLIISINVLCTQRETNKITQNKAANG